MVPDEVNREVEKLNILSVNRLGDILKIPGERLLEISTLSKENYDPFERIRPLRPFQKKPPSRPRQIDNPSKDLSWIQKRINRRLLTPICFPKHICGAVRKRSVLDNAQHHLSASLLVTIDIKQCFPSITNTHVYSVWGDLLGCSPPVASMLTRLTTFDRHLPQGAATSPLLANLFIWMIDRPIRCVCEEMGVAYSTWIDDLAFSGDRARHLIEPAALTLRANGLRISRAKIRIMGASSSKLITGARLGENRIRAPRDKLSRIRSGIHKYEQGLIPPQLADRYITSLVAQLRFIKQLCPKDASFYTARLKTVAGSISLPTSVSNFLTAKE